MTVSTQPFQRPPLLDQGLLLSCPWPMTEPDSGPRAWPFPPMPASCLGSQHRLGLRDLAGLRHGLMAPLPPTHHPTLCHIGATPGQPIALQLPAAPWSLACHLLYSETGKLCSWRSPGLWPVFQRKVLLAPSHVCRLCLVYAAFALCQVVKQRELQSLPWYLISGPLQKSLAVSVQILQF